MFLEPARRSPQDRARPEPGSLFSSFSSLKDGSHVGPPPSRASRSRTILPSAKLISPDRDYVCIGIGLGAQGSEARRHPSFDENLLPLLLNRWQECNHEEDERHGKQSSADRT